ncbi:MAG: type IV pilus secretin PilQ [Pseudomonadota bacterium]|nr:type IV pilus secretin PilQ [Pseudomonadota bacterium]
MNDINKVTRKKSPAANLLVSVLLLTCLLFPFSNAEGNENIISLVATAQGDTVTLSFTCSATKKIDYKIFTLDAPSRLVIDFPKASFIKNNVNDIIKKSGYTRLRSFDSEERTRIVLDTDYTALPPFTQQARNQELLITLKKAAPGSPKNAAPTNTRKSRPFKQRNNPISVDFKGTDVQNVFRFLAEINHLNVVMGDDVNGTVTLRLKEVPWKQVLSIVLKTHQLGMERVGNVVRIAPLGVFAEEQRAQEEKRRAVAESKKTDEEIQDTVLKILKVNFANIDEVAGKIENTILSDRGSVETDPRTNSLIIRDIPDRISQAQALLRELDEPVKQVMIEAKIVKIETDAAHEFGVQWGGAWGKTTNDRYYGVSGNNNLGSTGAPPVNPGPGTDINPNYAVNLPADAITSGIGMIFGKINKYNLSVQLSAMQEEGTAHILSNPKVLALNQNEATIGQGSQIPYQTTSQDGTTTEFQDAELSLHVTPTITNNNMVSMIVKVTKDSLGQLTPDGYAINTQRVETSLLLKDGETAVVGGIIESDKKDSNDSVPVVGQIPLLGWLFKHDLQSSRQTELMIFITPQIIK